MHKHLSSVYIKALSKMLNYSFKFCLPNYNLGLLKVVFFLSCFVSASLSLFQLGLQVSLHKLNNAPNLYAARHRVLSSLLTLWLPFLQPRWTSPAVVHCTILTLKMKAS